MRSLTELTKTPYSRTAALTISTTMTLCFAGSTGTAAENPQDAHGQAAKPVQTVRCGAGQSINSALRRAEAGATLQIRGMCHERVVITQAVTLDGGGSAVIDGGGVGLAPAAAAEFDGVVVVDGVTGVSLVGLTIQNGVANGVFASHGASILLKDVTTQNNHFTGIVVSDNSTVEAVDSVTKSNGDGGFDVFTSSSLILKGTFVASSNGTAGGSANGQSIVELRGAQVTATDNPVFGIIIGSRSHLAVFGFASSAGSTLNVSGSGFAGIGIADSSFTLFSDTVVTATHNGIGLLLAPGQVTAPDGRATFVLDNNGIGMNAFGGSSTFLVAGLNVHDNGTGVMVDDSSLSIEAAPGLPASIAANGTDVQLSFGTRSTIQNVTVATPLICEPNVLSRGTAKCP